jgi:hypothetical protein
MLYIPALRGAIYVVLENSGVARCVSLVKYDL